MSFEEIISGLSENEKKVLLVLNHETVTLKDIIKKTKLKEILIMRALQWLSNKKLIILNKKEDEFFILGKNGKHYLDKGLPEHTFLKTLKKKEKISMSELTKIISKEEINACIGLLKKHSYINISKEDELFFSISSKGKKKLDEGFNEEKILKKIKEKKPIKKEDESIISELLKRKDIVIKEKKSEWFVTLTDAGKQISSSGNLEFDLKEKVTTDLIKKGNDVVFRKYDVKSSVPSISVGRKHIVTEAKKYIKSIWLELGFEEMKGDFVQTAFWNLDALFVPQDHPAREMQDTFYVEGKKNIDKNIFEKVKKVHENGGDTGSKGWKSKFSKDVSEELLLRTHTTVLSAIKFSELKKEDLPKKFFVVDKNFRNEALDWKHLFEFQQVDGIVVDLEGNMPKLKSYLKEFFLKMGFSDVRIRPAHFPYTEPSAEVEAYNPEKKEWVEMGGAGIIRPEVSKTLLGFECPVLAWGLGMERIISKYYELTDIRDIYKNNIEYLKNAKIFIK